MAVIQLIIALVILGIIYRRMIKREVPEQISGLQGIIPVGLGVASLPVSFYLFLGIGNIMLASGASLKTSVPVIQSILRAFFSAGFPEEIAKLIFMIIAILIFRSKISNVYEYILIGAAVGFGFTLLEEFFYGSGGLSTMIVRLICIAAHMVFGMIMAKHLGLARYNRKTGNGSAAKEYILAVLIPIIIHTLYDAFIATNVMMGSENGTSQMIGMGLAIAATVVLFIIQIRVIVQFKKNAEKYCSMTFA